jgi:predicted transport protein
MSDIKLFRTGPQPVTELQGSSVTVEKTLQSLIEADLDTFLGLRFLATEYSTGKTHGGRIDTLCIDENNCPVIIEYKRATNENVINQGLFYLDWLLDHRGEFTLLAMKQLGADIEGKIDWSNPRLLCMAGNFTRYDEHAIQQINRNIELFRYRDYGGEFLVLELVNAVTGAHETSGGEPVGAKVVKYTGKTVSEYYAQAPSQLRGLFDSLEAYLLAQGDDVTRKTLKFYFAFRRIKNFACVEVHPQTKNLLVYLKVDPAAVDLESGFTRDVSSVGHYGTGDLEVKISSADTLERAKPLILRSYDTS